MTTTRQSKTRRRKRKPKLQPVVCKPCWELKYCPYGWLVEFFPLHPDDQSVPEIEKLHDRARDEMSKASTELQRARAAEFFFYSEPGQWRWVKQYDTKDLECGVFGHVCPVFFAPEPVSEGRRLRCLGRRVPRDIQWKVLRRDGQVCQICHRPVRDEEVEFDHLIPFSKGGAPTAENLRVTHRKCNRKKSNSVEEILARL